MNNNDDKKLTKTEYFDLRERRLKLVYKILYAVVALWIATLLSVGQSDLEQSVIPVYSFILSASSMVIIQIIKYAIMEFRCMKIIGCMDEKLMKQTENHYDNIWVSVSCVLSWCGLALVIHYIFAEKVTSDNFISIFAVGVVYFSIMSIVKLCKKTFPDNAIKLFDTVGMVIGSIATYSLCAAFGLIVNTTV